MTGITEERDQGFLLETVRRAPLLDALRVEPQTASELVESLDYSRSTVHRATTTLEEYDLIEKRDGAYELTSFGETVAEETAAFDDRVSTARALEPFLNTIDVDGVPLEHFADAEVTRPKPRLPHASIQRIIELIESSSEMRLLSTVISPVYVNVAYHEMLEGMRIEGVFERQAVEIMLAEYEEKAHETIGTGNFDVLICEEIPFELFLFDDRMGMAAHDENGIAQVFVECDAPSAIAWAEDIYSDHRTEAEPLLLTGQ